MTFADDTAGGFAHRSRQPLLRASPVGERLDGACLGGGQPLVVEEPEPQMGPSAGSRAQPEAPFQAGSGTAPLQALLEWLDGPCEREPPDGVSTSLAAFARCLNQDLSAVHRDALRLLAPRLARSASTPAREGERAWRIAHWMVQVQAPIWLRLAGFGDLASALGRLDLGGPDGKAAAMGLLADAAIAASNEVAASAATDAAWEVWEATSNPSGWAAACEAAAVDASSVFPELPAAANQRVVDIVRDGSSSRPIDGAALTNEVWSVALRVVADHLWTRGWRAADTVTTSRANTDLAGPALGEVEEIWDAVGGVDYKASANAARDAGRGPLARAGMGIGGELTDHPWELALLAAGADEPAAAWWDAVSSVRQHVGPGVWAEAMAAAQAEIDARVVQAPDLVDRVRLVAVAREACGAAARLAAARAMAKELVANRGAADPVESARRAAGERLRSTAEDLGGSAVVLLARLLPR